MPGTPFGVVFSLSGYSGSEESLFNKLPWCTPFTYLSKGLYQNMYANAKGKICLLYTSNKAISNLVGLLLPRAIINPGVRLSGIKNSTKCNQLTKEERKRLAHTINNLKMTVLRFRPISEAVITLSLIHI